MPTILPLTAIRAFETAARHLSCTRAADELCVTQSAISRHIRFLEERLQSKLFVRANRRLYLTPEGQRYFDDLTGLFRQMNWATERAMNFSGQTLLSLYCHTSFAEMWLIPRLSQFHKKYPNISMRLSASTTRYDSREIEAHSLVRSGIPPRDGATELFPVQLVTVCSPEYREQMATAGQEDFSSAVLIHALGAPASWITFIQACGATAARGARDLHFETTSMAVQAAQRGLGIAIAPWHLVEPAITANELVLFIPKLLTLDRCFYFESVTDQGDADAIELFRTWLVDEVGSQRGSPATLQKFSTPNYML